MNDSLAISSRVDALEELRVNPEVVIRFLSDFIRDEVTKVGLRNGVVGLSGGVDSSTSAYLACRALGPDHVWGILMPYKTTHPDSLAHAKKVVEELGIHSMTIDITPMVDGLFGQIPAANNVRRGNAMARCRMIVLYDQSAALDALVLGTSNKTEYLLGYSTLWGDMACAINPLGDLYKAQVWQLAASLGVPKEIVEKAPSADLWTGQTDEDELGFTYREADRLLYYMVDKRYTFAELEKLGYKEEFVRRVFARIRNSQYKRRLPVIAKLSHRTIDRDFRYPRDWGV